MGSSGSKEKVPADTVLLHSGFGRLPTSPCFSPFVFKVEVYLRMNKIPYKFTEKGGMGPKGKVPWVEYNGETVCDSQFIIEYLNQKLNVDLNKNLTETEKATATAFRIMAEEYLNFSTGLEFVVWNDASNIKQVINLPTPIIWIFQKKALSNLKAQGIGRHSKEEVHHIVDTQLSAISAQLGDKPYLMGDEPSEVDCSLAGVLGCIRWVLDEEKYPRKQIERNEKYKNLDDYLERIKTTYFPDWDELLASADKNKNKSTTNLEEK